MMIVNMNSKLTIINRGDARMTITSCSVLSRLVTAGILTAIAPDSM